MNEYIFLSADRRSVSLRTAKAKVAVPPGSYAATAGKIADAAFMDRWTLVEREARGVARVVPGTFDAATERAIGRDFEHNPDGTIKVTNGEAFEVLNVQPIPQEELEAAAAAALAAAQGQARADLATAAEAARLRFVTPGAAKAMVYRQKKEEARAWRAILADGGVPAPEDFPLMAARSARFVVTMQAVADEWNGLADGWIAAAAAIEDAYDAALIAVASAADAAAVQAIVAAVQWPAPPEE